MRFINSLRSVSKMQDYLISKIPRKNNLKYVNVGPAKHGRDLLKLSNKEALDAVTSETPDKRSKISTL